MSSSSPHRPAGVWAVVPVKSPRRAKTRLAALLDDTDRARLVEAMLLDVLDALAGSTRLAGTLLVTPDDEIARLARDRGALVLLESRSGLNEAILQAREELRESPADALLVIPGDLPLLTAASVDRLLATAPAAPSVVVAPDAGRTGTNALLLTPPGVVDPAFGPHSFAEHSKRARDGHAALEVVTAPELEHDLDEPGDVEAILTLSGARGPGDGTACRTIRLLERLEIASRLARAREAVDER